MSVKSQKVQYTEADVIRRLEEFVASKTEEDPDYVLSANDKDEAKSFLNSGLPGITPILVANVLNSAIKKNISAPVPVSKPAPVSKPTSTKVITKPEAKKVSEIKREVSVEESEIKVERKRVSQNKKQVTVSGSSRTTKTKVSVSYSSNKCNGLKLIMNDSTFTEHCFDDVDSSEYEFSKDQDTIEAETEYVEILLGKQLALAYLTACQKLNNKIAQLMKKYKPIKKDQKFKFVAKTKSVSYIECDGEEKTGTLPSEEIEEFITYHNTMKKVSDAIKKHEDFENIDLLTLKQINTQNIIKFESLNKICKDEPEENKNKTIGTIDSEVNAPDEQIKLCSEDSVFNTIDYIKMFRILKSFNTAKLNLNVKAIFNMRDGILKHNLITDEFKYKCWFLARKNMLSIEDTTNYTERETKVIECWKSILSSRFAYQIIMECVPANPLFKKAIEGLITEGMSFKLYLGPLYPISFIFTPLMCGYKGIPKPTLVEALNETKYKEEINRIFRTFADSNLALYDYDKLSWIYYHDKSDEQNQTACLLSHMFNTVPTEPKTKGKGGKGKSTEATEDMDDNDDI